MNFLNNPQSEEQKNSPEKSPVNNSNNQLESMDQEEKQEKLI